MSARRVVLAAGGTGGHMFPAQALAEVLRERGWSPALVTDERGLALAQSFPADPISVVAAATVSPRNPFKAIPGALKIAGGVSQARELLKKLSPQVVVGFGGYPAFPALAACGRRTPIVLHEQNAVLGRVNRMFAGKSAAIASGFKRLESIPPSATGRWVITGNPVRAPIVAVRDSAFAPGEDGPLRLLILGGSLGARILSEITPRAVARLPEALRARLRVAQQTRAEWVDEAHKTYADAGVEAECRPFFDDIAERLADAHLVVARAGASTVTELAVVGRPSILVPLRIAMDDHQTLNAQALADTGGADIIAEADFEGQKLSHLLADRLSHPVDLVRRAAAARTVGRPDAAASLADLVERVAAGRPV